MNYNLNELNLDGWEKKEQIIKQKSRNILYQINDETLYIFVLAGGLQENGEVHEFVKTRLDKAIEIYNEIIESRPCKIIVMGGGTYHKPPILNESNYVIHESSSCALYLTQHGNIESKNIYREWSSYDTIANGYYAYLNYIQPLDIKKFTLITSDFHMPRAKVIFNYFNSILFQHQLNIHFIETPNNEMEEGVLKERCEREYNSKLNFQQNIVQEKRTISDFTKWFYEEHGAYKSIIYYQQNDTINKSY